MWDLSSPGIKLVFPALQGRFLTTGPPGKPPGAVLSRTVRDALIEVGFWISAWRVWGNEPSGFLEVEVCPAKEERVVRRGPGEEGSHLGSPAEEWLLTVALMLGIDSRKKKGRRQDQSRQHVKKQRHYFVNKGLSSQNCGFSTSHVWMWELNYKESWAPKKWTVVLEKTVESPLDCKEIQPVHHKENQSWIFIGRTDAEAETPILWPPDAKNWLIWKDPDAGKDWRQEEKGTTEDGMVGWHHWLYGHEFE